MPQETSPSSIESDGPTTEDYLAGLTFMDLPKAVRHQIYFRAGLARFCPISLNREDQVNLKQEIYGVESYNECFFKAKKFWGSLFCTHCQPRCLCRPLPTALFYVSKAVSRDSLSYFYSENTFAISRSGPLGLKPLMGLAPNSLHSLRSLTVTLNKTDCIFAGIDVMRVSTEFIPCHTQCRMASGIHDEPLCIENARHLAVLSDGAAIMKRLAALCDLRKLRIDFTCDTKDLLLQERVLECLKILPFMKSGSIRLAADPSWATSQRAKLRTLELTGYTPTTEASVFQRLPIEIIRRVLYFTDLVAPYDLEWSPETGLVLPDCCKMCTSSLESCACPKRFGAFSDSCTCWRLPIELFLVNRDFYEFSMSIFYSQNRFLVTSGQHRLDNSLRSMAPLRLSSEAVFMFLGQLSRRATALLRHIGVVVQNPQVHPERSWSPAEYEDCLSWLRRCNLRNLCLSIFIPDPLCQCLPRIREAEALDTVPQADERYQPLIESLRALGRLKKLFIYLQRPRFKDPDAFVHNSAELERAVAGPDYDSAALGKWDRPLRLWTDRPHSGPVYDQTGEVLWENRDSIIANAILREHFVYTELDLLQMGEGEVLNPDGIVPVPWVNRFQAMLG